MYPYMNEDVAFERLKDLQCEMENSTRLPTAAAAVARNLAARVWWLGALAMHRPPRRRPAASQGAREEA
ncbi:MAG: hypothetical protein ABI401_02685 [Candidatus Dormibacter sp.]